MIPAYLSTDPRCQLALPSPLGATRIGSDRILTGWKGTGMTDEEKRIRSYLEAQGAKLSPAAIIDKVRAAMADLRVAAEAVPADRFTQRPAAGEWSANEVMAHVVAAGAYFGGCITSVLDGTPAPPRMRNSRRGRRICGFLLCFFMPLLLVLKCSFRTAAV